MLTKTRVLCTVLALSLPLAPLAGCTAEGTERWATTENTNVAIDWDKVNEAYKAAEGPEDLEKRINEIYQGDEVISISVHDTDAKTQEVVGFFDKNTSGSVDEGEKVFTIKREVTGEGTASMQTMGYGAYAGYHSPVLSIVTGMMLGSMMSRAFMPGYVPMYSQPYRTSAARTSHLRASRPARVGKASGRAYGTRATGRTGGFRSSGGFRGGGRFGLRVGARAARPVLLTA
jgi:hypothetical protein